jgi:hypothetical protein
MYDYYLICCSSMYAYYVDIYLLLMDDAWKKGRTPMLCKNWHSHALIDIQNPMHNLRGEFSISMNC